MQSVCCVLFVYSCDLAIRESAQLGSSGAARTLATFSVTVTVCTVRYIFVCVPNQLHATGKTFFTSWMGIHLTVLVLFQKNQVAP